jgi:hypothetical protein
MRNLTIDSMVLQLSGLPEFEARRLVLEITRKWADEELAGAPREIPALRVQAPAPAKENTSQLASLIVAEMLREIRRVS